MLEGSDFSQDHAFALYVSQSHDCSYLPDQEARNLFLDPSAKVTVALYQQLIDRGFRRSGCYLYQPACSACNACVSLRLPVATFAPSRSQRRNWRSNLPRYQVEVGPADYSEEQFRLYKDYLCARHPDGAMSNTSPEQYTQFLSCEWADTRFIRFRREGRLAAVAVSDILPEGTSAVYTFFDPALVHEGLGVFALLWQIEYTRSLGKAWLYPGFWIRDCDKMNYKTRFRPYQYWTGQQWVTDDLARVPPG